MSDHRWQGYTHAELFAQIHQGSGPDASTSSIRRWTELSEALDEIDSGLATAMNAARSQWQGEAADRAQDGLRPLGEWTATARDAADRMRACAEHQAELIGRARAEMPPPVPVTAEEPGAATSLIVHLFGGQTDYEVQEARSHAAEQHAFEVMQTYQAASAANTTSLASFPAPPRVVVDSPSVQSGGQGASGRAVTITWSPTTATGPRTSPGSATRGAPGSRAARPSGHGSRAGGSARPSSSGPARSSGGRRAVTRHRERDEPDSVDRVVTEEDGEPGALFDEQRTVSRPVIGGEPG